MAYTTTSTVCLLPLLLCCGGYVVLPYPTCVRCYYGEQTQALPLVLSYVAVN
jgi:hypothetical protein